MKRILSIGLLLLLTWPAFASSVGRVPASKVDLSSVKIRDLHEGDAASASPYLIDHLIRKKSVFRLLKALKAPPGSGKLLPPIPILNPSDDDGTGTQGNTIPYAIYLKTAACTVYGRSDSDTGSSLKKGTYFVVSAADDDSDSNSPFFVQLSNLFAASSSLYIVCPGMTLEQSAAELSQALDGVFKIEP